MLTALEAVMLDHGIDGEVVLGVHPGEAGEHQVVGDNGSYPLCITRCYLWRPRFESDVELAVGRAAPSAKVVIDWDYPDERH
ncbi:hypothetical protein [Kitasatospora sp. NPDC050543]|uniref:hypothetical protein n=1 Tax=Kitasatospora sp. NPDC050543 TaxID=3364054 RepID=UPI0037BC2721